MNEIDKLVEFEAEYYEVCEVKRYYVKIPQVLKILKKESSDLTDMQRKGLIKGKHYYDLFYGCYFSNNGQVRNLFRDAKVKILDPDKHKRKGI